MLMWLPSSCSLTLAPQHIMQSVLSNLPSSNEFAAVCNESPEPDKPDLPATKKHHSDELIKLEEMIELHGIYEYLQ